ncbi:MAG TPA: hypothetical protein VKO18_00545 [Terriglobia bacterium]|nr:hypothetical protein [Terriglobia bacterium]
MEKWHIYVGEARTQIEFAKRCYAAYLDAAASNNVSETFFQLHHFIVHAVNVDKLLDAKPGSERAAILSGHLNLEGVDLKPFRRLRNHLEHFDERLDMWVSKYYGQPFFDMNIVTGAKGFRDHAFLRALDGDIFMFHGEDYPLSLLYEQLLEIEKRIPQDSG